MGSTTKVTFIGWVAFLGGVYLFSKSRTGYTVIYYALILILALLLVGNYRAITSALVIQQN